MNLSFRRDAKSKITLSKINALLPVHDKVRSDQLTDKTGSPVSPKRRTSRVCGIRISAGQQHMGFSKWVKRKYAPFASFFQSLMAVSSMVSGPEPGLFGLPCLGKK